MQTAFGTGNLWGTRNDISGVGPDVFGILQEASIENSFETKTLYGQLQFPVDIARAKGTITGKAKMAQIFAGLYGDLFYGISAVAGETNTAVNEPKTVATTTVTVSNATSYVSDLGVNYATGSASRLTFVTGAPSMGQYTTGNNGVYTFAAGDIGASVAISYTYTDLNGKTITVTNQFMGTTPTFQAVFHNQKTTLGKLGQETITLPFCTSSKLTFNTKVDDFTIPDFDFMAFANAIGQVIVVSTSE